MDTAILTDRARRVKRWLLIRGDRGLVALVILGTVLVGLLLLGIVWPIQFNDLLQETTIIQDVFITLLSGVILLVSIVVAVVSVGVSQELTTMGDERARFDEAVEHRETLEEHEGLEFSPAETGPFLGIILQEILTRIRDIHEMEDLTSDDEVREKLEALADAVNHQSEELLAIAEGMGSSTTQFVAGLDYTYSEEFQQINELLKGSGDSLSDDAIACLEELQVSLRLFLLSRSYFETLYYKREFADLSRTMLIVSLPVILFTTYVLLALDAGLFPDVSILSLSPLTIFISLAYTIALAPYVVLTAYILRAATVTARTVAVGPFVHRSNYLLDR